MSAAEAAGHGLRVEDLELHGAGGRRLLKLPLLSFPAGHSVAVRGPSGAGKTTLLNALAGFLRPKAGRIVWGKTDLTQLREEARSQFRARHMGLVFQDFLLFEELSALENAAVAHGFAPAAERAKLREDARKWLERLGLRGGDTRRIATFSGGERQRVAVARALVGGASIILADEPTASLDRESANRLIDDLVTLAGEGGQTLVAVTHDPALIERLGRVWSIEDGRFVGEETHV